MIFIFFRAVSNMALHTSAIKYQETGYVLEKATCFARSAHDVMCFVMGNANGHWTANQKAYSSKIRFEKSAQLVRDRL